MEKEGREEERKLELQSRTREERWWTARRIYKMIDYLACVMNEIGTMEFRFERLV